MNRIEECPVFGMYAASRKLVKIYSRHLDDLNLTYPQYLTIACLQIRDECSLDEIGQQLFLDSGTLTPLLKRLETMGFIIRGRSKEDERRIVIKLTENGKSLQKPFERIQQDIRTQVGMSMDDVQQLKALLRKILSVNV